MDNLNDLKTIWLSANTSILPDTAEMMKAIKKYRSSKLVKKVALILMAIILTVVMIWVVFNYKSVMMSTRIGEALMLSAGIMLIYTNGKSLGRLYRVKDHTNKEFIEYLEQVQRNRIYYHRKTQVLGLSLVSAGLLLYVYEALYNHPIWCFIGYLLLILYLLVIWLIIRPKAYRKQQEKLQQEIKKMTLIAKQLKTEYNEKEKNIGAC